MMHSKREGRTGQSNLFTLCFVEETGGILDKRTRIAIRSHVSREGRRRRRVQQQLQESHLSNEAIPSNQSQDLPQAFLENPNPKLPESFIKRPRHKVNSFLTRPVGPKYEHEDRQTFDESLARQILEQKFLSLLSTSIGDIFDPFRSTAELSPLLSLKYSKDINAVKAHALEFCFPGNTKTVVFPEALRTPALLGSIMYMAYANLATLQRASDPKLALALKTAAISQLNKKISHPSTATCTSVIASIAYLSTGTWIFGDEIQETAAHLVGIQSMVKHRGMKSLGVYRFGQTIQKYLFIQHAVMQAMSAQPFQETFHFDYDIGNGALESTTSNPEANPRFLCNIFMVLHNSKNPNQQTTSVLMSTKALMDILLAHYEGESNDDETTFNIQFCALRSQIHSHLSAYDPMCPCHGDFTYESVRISCLIIVEAIEARKLLHQTSQLTASCLSSALERTNISSTWGDMLGVLYWVSMIGNAGWKGRGGSGEKLMNSTLARTMFKATFEYTNLGCTIQPARLFGRVQMALQRRSEMTVSR